MSEHVREGDTVKNVSSWGFCGIIGLVLACGTVGLAGQAPDVISAVRGAVAQGNFAAGERIVGEYRAAHGVTPELMEALSWLGRGALASKQWEKAEDYATRTYELARAALKARSVDQEPHLPIALGAAIEVQSHVSAALGARSEAVLVLQRELDTYMGTSLVKRIQKNINLLSLEGKAALPIDVSEYLGPKPLALAELRGKVVILFFWAHWCPDCKMQGPVLARLMAKYRPQGLSLVAPSQRYGYAARGKPVTSDEELRYIRSVRDTSYRFLADEPVPLSEENHVRYGVSTTPTLVLVDRAGVVRLYHPGRITEEELEPIVRGLLADRQPTER